MTRPDGGDPIARLRALPTAAVSDALDRAGIDGALHGLSPLSDGFRAVGPAFTVRYEPVGDNARGTVGDFLDDVPPGAVIVIDNGGRTDVTVWGGIMTGTAAARGIAGTVVDGVCRDVSASLEHGYPLFSTRPRSPGARSSPTTRRAAVRPCATTCRRSRSRSSSARRGRCSNGPASHASTSSGTPWAA
ncbi:RraA family protein [Streptomyces sp. NPDC046915]|uniref:RraA family protein n=1 Tax=Streptomyces sp. NPDC046915 TaxID=3155257 RepID=UPI0033DEBF49